MLSIPSGWCDVVEGPSRGDTVKGWKIMGCSVRSDNLF